MMPRRRPRGWGGGKGRNMPQDPRRHRRDRYASITRHGFMYLDISSMYPHFSSSPMRIFESACMCWSASAPCPSLSLILVHSLFIPLYMLRRPLRSTLAFSLIYRPRIPILSLDERHISISERTSILLDRLHPRADRLILISRLIRGDFRGYYGGWLDPIGIPLNQIPLFHAETLKESRFGRQLKFYDFNVPESSAGLTQERRSARSLDSLDSQSTLPVKSLIISLASSAYGGP
jgi:hypothetical protein